MTDFTLSKNSNLDIDTLPDVNLLKLKIHVNDFKEIGRENRKFGTDEQENFWVCQSFRNSISFPSNSN